MNCRKYSISCRVLGFGVWFRGRWYRRLACYQRSSYISVSCPLIFVINKLLWSFLPTLRCFHRRILIPSVATLKILISFYTKIRPITWHLYFLICGEFFNFMIIFLRLSPSKERLRSALSPYCICERRLSSVLLVFWAYLLWKYSRIQMSKRVLEANSRSRPIGILNLYQFLPKYVQGLFICSRLYAILRVLAVTYSDRMAWMAPKLCKSYFDWLFFGRFWLLIFF